MAEYIEREALIHSVTSRKVQEMLRSDLTDKLIGGRNPSDWLNGFDVGMQQAINIIATADVVEVRHGEWAKKQEDLFWWLECSVCGEIPPKNRYGYYWQSEYCPNCGAKMDGKGEGE